MEEEDEEEEEEVIKDEDENSKETKHLVEMGKTKSYFLISVSYVTPIIDNL